MDKAIFTEFLAWALSPQDVADTLCSPETLSHTLKELSAFSGRMFCFV